MGNRRLPAILVMLLALTVGLSGCGDSSDDSGVDLSGVEFQDLTGEDAVVVEGVDNSFRPAYIEVKAGTEVTFRNGGRANHNVLPAKTGDFKGIETTAFTPGDEATITFDEPGDRPYYCSLHGTKTKGMIGAIRVT